MEGYVEKIEDSGVFELPVDMLTSMIGSVQIMRCKASAASIIDVRDMMIGMAINMSTTGPNPASDRSCLLFAVISSLKTLSPCDTIET